MELPASVNKCLAVAMLRTLGLNQKDVARITRCADQIVVNVEKWLREEDYDKVARLYNDKDIEKMVAVEGIYWGLEPDNFLKLSRLAATDILRKYRAADYMKNIEEAEAKAKLKENSRRANIMDIRHEAGLPLSPYINEEDGSLEI